jgi:hypothetical protein
MLEAGGGVRSIGATVAVILMTVGLAVLGWVNPTVGIVCLFGGAALWIVCQKKTVLLMERALASKSQRQEFDARSTANKHIREQFVVLSTTEKEAIKHVRVNGHILPQLIVSHLVAGGFPDSTGVVERVRSKTPFLIGSYSGEFSINPELKNLLDELLEPPLVNAFGTAVTLLLLASFLLGCGYLFRKYVYPTDRRPSPPISNSPPSVRRDGNNASPINEPLAPKSSPKVQGHRRAANAKPIPANKQQGQSNGAVGGDINTGPCSTVQIGGSGNQSTVNCGPQEPNIAASVASERMVNGNYQLMVTLKTDIEITSNVSFTLVFDSTIEHQEVKVSTASQIGITSGTATGVTSKYPDNILTFSIFYPPTLAKGGEIYANIQSKSPIHLVAWKRGI